MGRESPADIAIEPNYIQQPPPPRDVAPTPRQFCWRGPLFGLDLATHETSYLKSYSGLLGSKSLSVKPLLNFRLV